MLKIYDREWNTFKIGDIFKIENCKCAKVSVLKDGSIPYIGATINNNGIIRFVENKESLITKGNCIVFICDGEGSMGLSIYKSEDFIGTTTVKAGRCELLNRYTAMFITTVADKVRGKYNFGYKRNEKSLKRETINLPITSQGTPDWQFMEAYMKQIENIILGPITDKLCKQLIANKLLCGEIFSHSQWNAFYFTEVFTDIQRGKRLKKSDHLDGEKPYISSTSLNNGVDSFIGNESGIRFFNNCITIANSGSVGSAFFHQYKFVASDHVTQLRRNGLDKYVYLFMLPLICRLSEKYSFNREINDERIKREKILLPVDNNGSIDFVFMSSFMKSVEHNLLETTLKTFSKRLNVNKREWGGVKWSNFLLRDVFPKLEPGKSKGLNHIDKFEKGISYLGATNQNNGVLCFVGNNTKLMQQGNCIAFIRNGEGSMGYSVYKAEDFVATSDMTIGYNEHLNKYTGTFITTVADRIRGKYNFGYKRSAMRLAKEILTLPVDKNNNPDWDYMESYMRNIESEHILNYLETIKCPLSEGQ